MIVSLTIVPAMSNVSFGLVIAATVVVIAVLTLILQRRRRTVWERFARKHGIAMHATPFGPRISGTVRGRPVVLETVQESSDTGLLGVEVIRMTVGVDGATAPAGLAVASVGVVADDLHTALKARHITTGNDAFDAEFLVTGTSCETVTGWLSEHRQFVLLNLATRHAPDTIALDSTGLSLQSRTAISRLRDLSRMFISLETAATALEDPTGQRDHAVARGSSDIDYSLRMS